MINLFEIVIIMFIVGGAVAYLIYKVFVPALRRKPDQGKPGCSDDCGCDAKDKIEELRKK